VHALAHAPQLTDVVENCSVCADLNGSCSIFYYEMALRIRLYLKNLLCVGQPGGAVPQETACLVIAEKLLYRLPILLFFDERIYLVERSASNVVSRN
jgi:hypothetical protein